MVSLPPLERGLRLLELVSSSSGGITYKQAHEYLGVTTATVARLLKVLVQMKYLIQENACYKTGPALQKLSPKDDIEWLLTHHAANLAEELADFINESCVVAAYSNEYFEFTGVKIIEDSIAYAEHGRKVYFLVGHVLTMISHAMMHPNDVKELFARGDISYGSKGHYPEWKDYVKSIITGMESGNFIEFGWRRANLFRNAIPVFSEDNKLAGAFFCGFHDYETLKNNLDLFMDANFKALSRINDYQGIFNRGMKGLRRNLELWQNELDLISR